MGQGWSEAEDDVIRAMTADGKGVKAMAAALPGRSRNGIIGRAHRLGVGLGAALTARQAKQREEAAKLWAEGIGIAVMAEILGVSGTTISSMPKDNRDLFPARPRGNQAGSVIGGKPWTEAELARVKDMDAAGKSAAEIAAALGGRTRNAVLGLLNRTKIGGGRLRRAPSKPRQPRPPREKTIRVAVRDSGKINASGFQLSGCEAFSAPPLSGKPLAGTPLAGKALMDLEWNDCRWPVNAAKFECNAAGVYRLLPGEQHLFCGAKALAGKPYCAAHHPYSFAVAAAPTIARPFGVRGKGKLLTKEQAFHRLYGDKPEAAPNDKILDVMISHIRKKLEGMPVSIDTVWGEGWKLDGEADLLLEGAAA
jgi:hypothetical protein